MEAYTKRGDLGYTHDYSGHRIRKDSIQIECWGRVDELQAIVDLTLLRAKREEKAMLETVQRKLWQTAAELACSPSACVNDPVTEKDLQDLERFIDSLGDPPHKFVRFNTASAIMFNECRVRARNLERSLVKMLFRKKIRPVVYRYINRLSSLFFMLAYKRIKGKAPGYSTIHHLPFRHTTGKG